MAGTVERPLVVGSIGPEGRVSAKTPGSTRMNPGRESSLTLIARIAHEVNRVYCEAMGDVSQPAWDDAPDWQRASAINSVQFHLANPDATPEQSHENWLKEKQEQGWVHGKVKDPEKKTHPCILPYSWLPLDQRIKDYLFRTVVHEAARLLRDEPRGLSEAEER